MKRHSIGVALLCTAASVFCSSVHGQTATGVLKHRASPQLVIDTELVTNGGFEQEPLGSGWTPVSGTAGVTDYGGVSGVSLNVAAALSGGDHLLGDVSGNAIWRQTIDISDEATQIDAGNRVLIASAALGGVGAKADRAILRTTYLTAGGVQLGSFDVGPVTANDRNKETVLLSRTRTSVVPSGTRFLNVDVVFVYANSSPADGWIDNVSIRVVQDPTPPPRPYGIELVTNGTFEAGYNLGSILTPGNASGWYGTNSSTVALESYELNGMIDVGQAIAGGGYLAGDFSGGDAVIRQDIDVSGNFADIDAGNVFLRLSACMGGIGGDTDYSTVRVRFLDSEGGLQDSTAVGPVTRANRNNETLLLRKTRVVPVPAGTRTLQLDAAMDYFNSGTADAWVDNVSAKILLDEMIVPVGYDTELLVNGDFENGYVASSAFSPGVETSWFGVRDSKTVSVQIYGLGDSPSGQASEAISGSTHLLGDTSGGAALMRQERDLRGNAADVDAGLVSVLLSGCFGGIDADSDRCSLEAQFFDEAGALLGEGRVGPITPENRLKTTLLMRRESRVPVPVGTRSVNFDLVMEYFGGNTADAFADNLSAVLTLLPPTPLPLGADLLVNGEFEVPSFKMPLGPGDAGSWVGATTSLPIIELYGVGTTIPAVTVADDIVGGDFLLRDSNGNSTLTQTFPLEGLDALVDSSQLAANLSAYLGGYSTDPDGAQVNLLFANAQGATLATYQIGPVTAADRANQTTLLFREGKFPVPAESRVMVCQVKFNYNSSSNGANGLVDNLALSLTNRTTSGFAQYPGTGEDLILFSGVAPEIPSAGVGFDVKEAGAGDLLTLRVDSLAGTFDYSPLVVFVGVYPTGAYPGPMQPGVVVPPDALMLVDGLSGGTFNPYLLYPTGYSFNVVVPPGLEGFSLLLQALAYPFSAPPGFSPQPPASGIFASTDGHEILVVP